MASIWTLAGADIYVDTYSENENPQLAALNPINSDHATIYHLIFIPNTEVRLEGTVVGSGYWQTIKDAVGTSVSLVTDLEPGGITVTLKEAKADRQVTNCQFIDLSQGTDAPVYRVSCVVTL